MCHFNYLKTIGVPWLLRKALKLASATKIITDNHNGTYRLENKAMKSTDWTFKLDETFEGLAFDGKTHRVRT